MNNLPEPAARAARTFIQAAIGTFLMLVIVPHAAPGYVPDFDTLKSAGIAAIFAGGIALLSFIQNWAEQQNALPAFAKPPTIVHEAPAPIVVAAPPAPSTPPPTGPAIVTPAPPVVLVPPDAAPSTVTTVQPGPLPPIVPTAAPPT